MGREERGVLSLLSRDLPLESASLRMLSACTEINFPKWVFLAHEMINCVARPCANQELKSRGKRAQMS